MSKLILDAGPLITACKFSVTGRMVIDYLLEACEIVVTESVRAEVVIAGARYADAKWSTPCFCCEGEQCRL